LSGGEPLLQRTFSRAILERCKTEGLHTAFETTAHCRWELLAELLPVTDLIMMDLKLMDPDRHRAATGVSNELILANAQRLVRTGSPILFRVPVVPTINDTPEEIGAIAAFVRQLADQRPATSNAKPLALELLAFHRLAADKYRSLGMSYRASDLEVPTKEKMEELKQAAISQGITIWA
jgi:pyruvate formate lyase activating enzyme